ncbi:MAG: DUF4384 domain-containing protein [candidate division Zixibacteria bacterium]|nr:DUF4384 domain-containing protein [candidate division Zixibacteria bacterium]MDH3938919.1 DUF4384 domain-containing protein [candidate division Zixibacteria bacterium]MDH4034111.1 DUF4384 domain-containing protein [candidate division Zixibacteria bacterium]
MLKKTIITPAVALLMCLMITGVAFGQNMQRDENGGPDYFPPDKQAANQDYGEDIRIDRYLDAEVWTNHLDGEYFVGDNVVLNFRTNRDAFVAIYSVDSRGRVNLLFPTEPEQDNFINGGVTYHLPGPNDDYDLVVAEPEGIENIQIIASRERFPIPDWHPVSGLLCDWDDRFEFMDYLNGRHFVRYGGQKFAFDRTAMYVNEWEPSYYRPVYYPYYPSWSVCGNGYIDYPWGASIYVDGIYWGCAPLYIPRIYVGWHTITVYNHWGHCWERDVHFTRYHTVILDRTIINPGRTNVSKYKDVRSAGYRDPVTNGYPKFKQKQTVATKVSGVKSKTSPSDKMKSKVQTVPTKKYARGSAKLISTDRGLESAGRTVNRGKRSSGMRSKPTDRLTTTSSGTKGKQSNGQGSDSRISGSTSGSVGSGGKRSSNKGRVGQRQTQQQSKDYYKKKSGSKTRRSGGDAGRVQPKRSGGKSDSKGTKPSVKPRSQPTKSRGGTKSQGVKQSGGTKSAPKSTPSSGGSKTKSSGGKTKKGGRK